MENVLKPGKCFFEYIIFLRKTISYNLLLKPKSMVLKSVKYYYIHTKEEGLEKRWGNSEVKNDLLNIKNSEHQKVILKGTINYRDLSFLFYWERFVRLFYNIFKISAVAVCF